jgi:ABC-type nitrate/sulfonate/bicarbonate transport system permease component
MNYKNLVKPFSSGPAKLIALAEFIILIVCWVLAPTSLFPSPTEVFKAWNTLAKEQGLLVELAASSWTIIRALFISSLISALFAYTAALKIFRPITQSIAALRFLGFAGITFMFTMLTHDGESLKLWLLVFGMTVFQVTNMLAVTNSITKAEIDYAKTLRLSPPRMIYELLVRGRLHEFLDIVRQNAAIGWVMLSMVEGLVRSDGGIGSLLITQSKFLNISAIFAIQMTILTYGIVQDYLLGMSRLMLCPYLEFRNAK